MTGFSPRNSESLPKSRGTRTPHPYAASSSSNGPAGSLFVDRADTSFGGQDQFPRDGTCVVDVEVRPVVHREPTGDCSHPSAVAIRKTLATGDQRSHQSVSEQADELPGRSLDSFITGLGVANSPGRTRNPLEDGVVVIENRDIVAAASVRKDVSAFIVFERLLVAFETRLSAVVHASYRLRRRVYSTVYCSSERSSPSMPYRDSPMNGRLAPFRNEVDCRIARCETLVVAASFDSLRRGCIVVAVSFETLSRCFCVRDTARVPTCAPTQPNRIGGDQTENREFRHSYNCCR